MKHHETVGGHLVASVLHAKPGERAGAVLERLAKEKPRAVDRDVPRATVSLLVYFAVVQAFLR